MKAKAQTTGLVQEMDCVDLWHIVKLHDRYYVVKKDNKGEDEYLQKDGTSADNCCNGWFKSIAGIGRALITSDK